MTPPVYQFKIVLNGVKPPVWRRVLVAGESTISFFHEVVQVSMGWYNCHLHQFVIRGKEYGVSYAGGVLFADDPDKVRLSEFRFQPQERFEYLYDFGDNWEHKISLEKILPPDTTHTYPICIGGRGESVHPRIPADPGCTWRAGKANAVATTRIHSIPHP
jgi:hypothetical protein